MRLLKLFCWALAVTISCQFGASAEKTNPLPAGMVLDLGEVSTFIKVTPEYSQAVFVAVLPYISDAAKKLGVCSRICG